MALKLIEDLVQSDIFNIFYIIIKTIKETWSVVAI